ncbi:hypothetical protein ACFV6U_35965 [Streptomyces sp. NPDC059810]|uniref:hypothetical protein n=1 Tax=Streptomyces sp. NPDC059810 TaxID=3346956 RepID=UPI0036547B6B
MAISPTPGGAGRGGGGARAAAPPALRLARPLGLVASNGLDDTLQLAVGTPAPSNAQLVAPRPRRPGGPA